MIVNTFDIIKSIFLLILAVSGNFVAETLGCKTQYILSKNMFAKQFVIILMIYFTLSFIGDKKIHPINNMKYTILIWTLFLMFTKMKITPTIICLFLLLLNYILHTYIVYYNQDYEKNKEKIEMLSNYYNYVNYTIILLICLGFINYFYKQYSEIGISKFEITKFLFGINECNSLK